jgi:peroxiredoxin
MGRLQVNFFPTIYILNILITKIDSLQKLIDETNIQFIKKNTNSIISISLLSTYGSSWGKKLSQNLYDKLSKNVQNSSEGKEFLKYLRLSQDVSIGNKYADFTQFDTLGRKRKLSDFIGKPLLIEFWASWCIPCRRNNPELLKVYKKFHKQGFEILGVSTDNKKQNWLQAIKTDKLIWQNVSELNGETNTAAQVYNIDQIPTNFLISKDGKIIARDIDNNELTKILTTLL